jgi:nicotinate-nucleotide adenylyltransferase
MKIGILGGSFNPPHKDHLNIALELLNKKIVDKVIFIPNIYNPLGKQSIDATKRLEMIKLMIMNNPNLEVSDIEINKTTQNYTYQTLDELKSIYPNDDIMLIIGSDNLNIIDKWMKCDYILNNYKVIVVNRNDDHLFEVINNPKISRYKDNIIPVVLLNNLNISSTLIRNLLLNKSDVSKFIDNSVYKYIINNNLYQ